MLDQVLYSQLRSRGENSAGGTGARATITPAQRSALPYSTTCPTEAEPTGIAHRETSPRAPISPQYAARALVSRVWLAGAIPGCTAHPEPFPRLASAD
jgi:hypothetical protein